MVVTTAYLFRTLAKHGVIWHGVTTAYVFALFLDAALIALLILCVTGNFK